MADRIVIVSAARTPIGGLLGELSLSPAVDAAPERVSSKLAHSYVDLADLPDG